MRHRAKLIVVGILAAVAWAEWVRADGVMLNGVSPRAISRGGTNIGFADNGAVLYDNPAAAVNLRGNGLFEAGVDMMLGDFHYANPLNDSAADDSLLPLPQISLIKKTANGRWAYGVGFYVPAGFAETYDLQNPIFGPRRYKSIGSLMKVLPGVAWKATDRLSVGATIGVAISHDELEGPYFLQNAGPLTGTPTLMDLQATGAALCWSVGMQYQLTDSTTIGLSYLSESRFHLDGVTAVTIPGFGSSAFDTTVNMTWPRSLGLGVRQALSPRTTFATDVLWLDWSRAFDDLGIRMTNPTTLGFVPIEERFPLDWRDSVSVRLGFEHALDRCRTLRCGYVYHRNPIPNRTLTPFIQAPFEHGFSAGYGWMWNCWNVDLGYMFVFGTDRTVVDSDFVGGDFDNSSHRAQMHCIALSLMRSF